MPSRGQRRLSDEVRFEQRPGGSEDVSQAVSAEMSSQCKGLEVCAQGIKVARAERAEVSGGEVGGEAERRWGPDLTAPCKDLGFSPEGVGRHGRVVGFKWIGLLSGGDSTGPGRPVRSEQWFP